MLLLGIDLGTSSVKVSVVDVESGQCLAMAQYPESESAIISIQPGWAEQSPDMWWEQVEMAIQKAHAGKVYDPHDISAIGIAYQMHGLVMVDREQRCIRNSIIWCDSRAVETGERAFRKMGEKRTLNHLLNSPGNFTASKLAWVKAREPHLYKQAAKIMLPGDFICMKLTGNITTSVSALSEGVFWDFRKRRVSKELLDYYKLDESLIPDIRPVFAGHGELTREVANRLNLRAGIPVSYKAGDQPNNALSLNVLEPGEVAATAGTSGVIYGVSDELTYDRQSRINSFAHVNHGEKQTRIGVLLCINGTGIMNSWVRSNLSTRMSYREMNESASKINIGSEGLRILPFGNGAERMLGNKLIGAHIHKIDLNIHSQAHIIRAEQEGIACAFRYGLDIMRENGMSPKIIRAGMANLFLSDLFVEAFVNTTRVPVELYNSDGSVGAAVGAGIGAGLYNSAKEAFRHMKPVKLVKPTVHKKYDAVYQDWKRLLEKQMS